MFGEILGKAKPGGFPLFSGKVQIVSRTLSGLFLVGALDRPKKRKITNRESPRTEQIGKIPEQIGKNFGSSKSLVLKSFWVERTFWDSPLLVSLTLWDTPVLFTPPLPLPQEIWFGIRFEIWNLRWEKSGEIWGIATFFLRSAEGRC